MEQEVHTEHEILNCLKMLHDKILINFTRSYTVGHGLGYRHY